MPLFCYLHCLVGDDNGEIKVRGLAAINAFR